MISTSVKVDLSGMRRFMSIVEDGLKRKSGPIRDVVRLWGRMYLSFTKERYDRFSKGGGDWPGLEESTIYRRRHGGKAKSKRGKRAYQKALATGGGQVSILRDTGVLFSAIDPTIQRPKGGLREQIPYGMEVGYGGPTRHPTPGSARRHATIAEIASYHHEGIPSKTGRKIRKVLVDPPADVLRRMADAMMDGIRRVLARSQVK